MKLNSLVAFLVSVLALGCGSNVVPNDAGNDASMGIDAGQSADAGSDGGHDPDAGPPFESACTSEPCELQWIEGPPLPMALDHHTTAILTGTRSDFVAVLGGVHTERGAIQSQSKMVYFAPIQGDGTLGEWVDAIEFLNPFSFHAQVQLPDNRIVLLGGISETPSGETTATGNIVYVGLDESGSPTVATGTPLPSAFRHPTAEAVGNTLYIIGGLGLTAAPQDIVMASELTEDGNDEWVAVASLPAPRSHHASVVFEGRIYIFGGYSVRSGDISTDVLRSVHSEDGTLTGWETVGTWDEATWTAAAFVHEDYVYLVGGGRGDVAPENTATIYRARLSDEIGAFEEVADPLPLVRSHVHQTPVHNGFVYSVAGRAGAEFTSTNRTAVGRLVAPR